VVASRRREFLSTSRDSVSLTRLNQIIFCGVNQARFEIEDIRKGSARFGLDALFKLKTKRQSRVIHTMTIHTMTTGSSTMVSLQAQ
jgi:hypothetical protein